MSNRLSNEKIGWILKEYSKTGNAAEVRRNWTLTFSTPAPTPRTIYRIRDKFNATGSVRNVPPPGRSNLEHKKACHRRAQNSLSPNHLPTIRVTPFDDHL